MEKILDILMITSDERAKNGDMTLFGDKMIIASSVLHTANYVKNLYVISYTDEKSAGDYVIVLNNSKESDKIYKVLDVNGEYLKLEGLSSIDVKKDICGKIIISNDKSLINCPNLSDDFINDFINEYNNKGDVIKKVKVGYNRKNGTLTDYLIVFSDNTTNVRIYDELERKLDDMMSEIEKRDNVINSIIFELDNYAMQYGGSAYGLPTYGIHIEKMKDIVRDIIKNK